MTVTAVANATELEAMLTASGAALIERDLIAVGGPDAGIYLQGQLSQDVLALAPGESALSFILAPDGKVEALVRVTAATDRYLLDCEAGHGAAVVRRLERFKLRVKVDIATEQRRWWAVRGPEAHTPATTPLGATILPCLWPGTTGYDVAEPPPVRAMTGGDGEEGVEDVPAWAAGSVACTPASMDALRVAVGMPAMGAELDIPELDLSVIPAETGLVGNAVSFAKGCYTGQELVERMAARGSQAPKRLCHVIMVGKAGEAGEAVSPGDVLRGGDNDGVAGRVTSVATLALLPAVARHFGVDGARDNMSVCLAYVQRRIEEGSRVMAGPEQGNSTVSAVPGTVRALSPLRESPR